MVRFKRLICLLLTVCALSAGAPALANSERDRLFEEALAALKMPMEIGLESKAYSLHPGERAYVPSVAPPVTPYDEWENTVYPRVSGSFQSMDDAVVSVDDNGLMTAAREGVTEVTHTVAGTETRYTITVSEETPTEVAKNMAYVALREFYEVKRARLPKYNKYAKWYYGKMKEVGWCSVFATWCANAAGGNPLKEAYAADIPDEDTFYLSAGQVGNQYDASFALDRFGSVPRVGYLVIYANMKNTYRTTHIGIVVDAYHMGDGVYKVTTVEGNMSNSVKSYCYLYDSKLANNLVGSEAGLKLQWNMSEVSDSEQTDPLVQYALHTDYWSVFGFCESWK